MRNFQNVKEEIVDEALDALVLSRGGDVARFPSQSRSKVVVRANWDRSKVAVITGGGSGHEPFSAGFVAEGLLTAAVCGSIFASPSVDAVLSAILAVTGDRGCVLIVGNYTGDRINFGLAAEQARAKSCVVEVVFVSDDIASPTNPRGLAGTMFVQKIAGCMSEQGACLSEIVEALRSAIQNTHTIGVARDTCSVPGNPKNNRIAEDEVEIGLGVHGEPGVLKKKFTSATALVQNLAGRLAPYIDNNARYAALFNNLGGLPALECGVLLNDFMATNVAQCVDYVLGPAALVTSLDMPGFSVSLIKLDELYSEALLADIPFKGWPGFSKIVKPRAVVPPELPSHAFPPSENSEIRSIVETIVQTCIEMEQDLNALDAKVGDGDTGSTFSQAARAVKAKVDELPFAEGADLFTALCSIVRESSGGTSGGLFAIMFARASDVYRSQHNWVCALRQGINAMQLYGFAKLGDRTLIDALMPAIEALEQEKGLSYATGKARTGANATAQMRARAGRSAYLDPQSLRGVNDPGAEAIARIFEGLLLK